jgi:predicted AAA+ superfamily ATPase
MNFQEPLSGLFERIARAIERLGPREPERPDFAGGDAFVWQPEVEGFLPVKDVNRVELSLLKGIDRMRDTLLENTTRFAKSLPANNALLWGARGMGKSSLVKAVHREVSSRSIARIWRRCRDCLLIYGRPPGTA